MASYVGTAFGEALNGEEGEDTLVGGRGADTLTGGEGHDTFVIDDGDSGSALGDGPQMDVITDWTHEDRLVFLKAQPAGPDALYAGVADSYEEASSLAQSAFAGGFEFASIKVGADVFVFAPRAESVVRLAGIDPEEVTASAVSPDLRDGESQSLSASADRFEGGAGSDTVMALDGDDVIIGGAGSDRVFAGLDNDSVDAGAGFNYVRGEEGDDILSGGADHDDLNGNMGRDTLDAGDGDDWVRGGRDDDIILAGGGADLVFGDLGDDITNGGMGNDLMHGGDGQDILRGDEGADTLVGDLGRDTLDGGLGGDVFVAQANSGDDRVLFFNPDEGDRVLVEAGTTYTLVQEGDDAVIEMAGSRMVLAGVQLSSLPSGWIIDG